MEQEKQKVIKRLGERIRTLRKEKGVSQEKFADESGVERNCRLCKKEKYRQMQD